MKKINSYILIPCFMLGIFMLGTDNLVIGPLLSDIAKDTNGTVAQMSLGISLYSAAYGIFAILLAPLSDIFGRRRIVVIAAILFGLTSICISTFHTTQAFYAFRFLGGMCAATLGPNLWAYSNENYEEGKRELVVSWMMGAFSLSSVLGIPIGLLIAGTLGWSNMFLFIGLISFVIAALFFFLGVKTEAKPFSLQVHFGNIKKGIIINWRLALSMLFSSAAYMCVYPFITEWLENAHAWKVSQTTVIFFVFGIFGLAGNLLSGIVSQKIIPDKIVKSAWSSQFAVILLLIISTYWLQNPIVFVVLFSGWMFLSNLGNTSFISLISSKAGDIRGSIMALNNSSIFLGFTLGSYLGGIAWGDNESVAVNSVVALIVSACSLFFLFSKGFNKSSRVSKAKEAES